MNTGEAFEILKQDLEKIFTALPGWEAFSIGNARGKDCGNENGLFKFKVYYEKGARYPSPKYHGIGYDPSLIQDYPGSRPQEKSEFLIRIIHDLQNGGNLKEGTP